MHTLATILLQLPFVEHLLGDQWILSDAWKENTMLTWMHQFAKCLRPHTLKHIPAWCKRLDSQEKAISVSQLIGKAFCLGQVKPVCSLLPLWQLLVDTCVASNVFYKQFGLQFLSRIYLETVRCWDFRVYFWLNFETFCCHRSNYLLPLCILQMHEEYICAPMLRFTYRWWLVIQLNLDIMNFHTIIFDRANCFNSPTQPL